MGYQMKRRKKKTDICLMILHSTFRLHHQSFALTPVYFYSGGAVMFLKLKSSFPVLVYDCSRGLGRLVRKQ